MAEIGCPNEGCSVKRQRRAMNVHRAECEHEGVTCPCPGCDTRLLRKTVNAHVRNQHLQNAETQLVNAWHQIRVQKAASESEQRLAAASTTSWVFNWRAEGWGVGTFESETHDFGDGVTGMCGFYASSRPEFSHFIGYNIEGRDKCRVHATFSILDKHDKILRQVHTAGTAAAPVELHFTTYPCKGGRFTPTAAEKAQSVRADGSIRLRVMVRLFPGDAV